jgi:cell division protein FtsL
VIRLNAALAVLLLICALALVTSQHRARRLFSQLAKEHETTKQIEVEWGQLQLEQSTWAMHARIEKVASGYLMMRAPQASELRLIAPVASRPASQPVRRASESRP